MNVRRLFASAFVVSFLVGCAGTGTESAAPPTALHTDSLESGPNLYVASGGGRRGNPPPPGGATVYGLQRGKLLQTITNGVDHPTALAIDASGEIYIANKEPRGGSNYSGSVSVYAIGAHKPTRILKETANPDALAFDQHGLVYVANKWYYGSGFYCSLGSVGVYAPGQTVPMRQIGGNGYVVEPKALAFDAAGNLYVANNIIAYGSCSAGNTVTIFPPNGSSPAATISDGIDYPCALALAPGVLYVANAPPRGVKHLPYGSVGVYDLGTNALLRTITDGIHTPDALALDGKGNLYVGNLNGRNVSVYAPGSTSPSRIITQGATSPKALLFGARGDLYVANLYQNTVSVYAPGKDSPRLTIKVPISDPVSIALSP